MSATRSETWLHGTGTAVRLVIVAVLVALALLPDRFLPGGQSIDVEGEFAGDPVEIRWTGEAAPYHLAIQMETGLCDVITLDAAATVVEQWWTQTTTYQGQIPRGGKVRLVARPGAEGYYHLTIGSPAMWGPTLMGARIALLVLSAALVAAWLFGARMNWRQWSARRRIALVIIAATTAFTGIVLYSIIHEAGHLLFGWLWGGTPALHQVAWTIFSGEEPHANFRSLPPEAVPWMGAGGMLLPTFVGCALVAVGFWGGGRAPRWLQLVSVTAGVVLLLGNLGLFASTDHTMPLALYLGFRGVLTQIVALMPAVLTLAVYAYIGYRLRVGS
jgi:hypothetical protein